LNRTARHALHLPTRTRSVGAGLLLLILCSSSAVSAGDLHPFTSDGCSLFPDGSIKNPGQWCDCCFHHDMAYWQGGSSEDRLRADEALRECVVERTGDGILAEVMYNGARTGGHPAFPTWYRWGYGWKYGRGYGPLTSGEQAAVAEKLDQYRRAHPGGYCPKSRKP
jgi:hypothetical protein